MSNFFKIDAYNMNIQTGKQECNLLLSKEDPALKTFRVVRGEVKHAFSVIQERYLLKHAHNNANMK